MSTSDKTFAEKRREKRFPIQSNVIITLADQRQIKGVCCNVSDSGLFILAEQSISVGSAVQLDIADDRMDFHATAKVVRAQNFNGQFSLGLTLDKKLPI